MIGLLTVRVFLNFNRFHQKKYCWKYWCKYGIRLEFIYWYWYCQYFFMK